MVKPSNYETQFVLKWEKYPAIDNIQLNLYEVLDNLAYNKTYSTQNQMDVYVSLRRKLSSHIFSTYIPTLCLVSIAGFTLFIDYSHFEATIMVALTTMLVIYTLHQGISTNLPQTSYMKMIDIWLFGGLVVPFAIIGILIVLDSLIIKESNKVMDMRIKNGGSGTKKTGWKSFLDFGGWSSKSFLSSMRIILLITTSSLSIIYWIIGLFHYYF